MTGRHQRRPRRRVACSPGSDPKGPYGVGVREKRSDVVTGLVGHQETDAAGHVRFTTIYPGWCLGRTVHIQSACAPFMGSSATYDFTTPTFFVEEDSASVFAANLTTRAAVATPPTTRTCSPAGGFELDLGLVVSMTGSSPSVTRSTPPWSLSR